jgi:hypothetical protein
LYDLGFYSDNSVRESEIVTGCIEFTLPLRLEIRSWIRGWRGLYEVVRRLKEVEKVKEVDGGSWKLIKVDESRCRLMEMIDEEY